MGARTSIEWTNRTWNPTRGCSRMGTECINCYAEGIARRFSGPGKPYEGLIHSNGSWNGKIHLATDHLLDPIKWVEGSLIFVDSMSDLFHENVPFEYVAKVFAVMACTTRHTYQVLTKRPDRMLEFLTKWLTCDLGESWEEIQEWDRRHEFPFWPEQVQPTHVFPDWIRSRKDRGGYDNCGPLWPLENVWLGVSCGNQEAADERITTLMKCPAARRFLSCEPLLGPINLNAVAIGEPSKVTGLESEGFERIQFQVDALRGSKQLDYAAIDWVIAGGESGPHARPVKSDWLLGLRDQCVGAGVPFFFKQWGEWAPPNQIAPSDWVSRHDLVDGEYVMRVGKKTAGRNLDGQEWSQMPPLLIARDVA